MRSGQAVYVTDASRAVGVVQALLSPDHAPALCRAGPQAEYAKGRRGASPGRGRQATAAARQSARDNTFKTDWASYEPPRPTFLRHEGVPHLRCRRARALYRLDAVLPDLGNERPLSRRFSKTRNRARRRANSSTMRKRCSTRIVEERWFNPKAVIGFWPANAVGDDIRLFTGEVAQDELATFFTLRQQLSKRDGQAQSRARRFRRPAGERQGGLCRRLRRHVRRGGREDRRRVSQRANDDYRSILVKALADRIAEALPSACMNACAASSGPMRRKRSLTNEERSPKLIAASARRQAIRRSPIIPRRRRCSACLKRSGRIGVTLTESFAMWPGSSVSGLYLVASARRIISASPKSSAIRSRITRGAKA